MVEEEIFPEIEMNLIQIGIPYFTLYSAGRKILFKSIKEPESVMDRSISFYEHVFEQLKQTNDQLAEKIDLLFRPTIKKYHAKQAQANQNYRPKLTAEQ